MELVLWIASLAGVAVVVMAIGGWAAAKSPPVRNVVTFMLAAGSSYFVGFVGYMIAKAAAGILPAANILAPSWSWLTIALACALAAFRARGSPYALAIPFFLNGTLALLGATVRGDNLVGLALLVLGVATFVCRRHQLDKGARAAMPPRASFPIGPYVLDSEADPSGLVELSPLEYPIIGRTFVGERIYKAPAVTFLGRSWNMMLGTVDGKIYKLAPGLELPTRSDAEVVARQLLAYCKRELGEPSEQAGDVTGWNTLDGNVIVQLGGLGEGSPIPFSVLLFITSKAVLGFQPVG